MSTRITHRIGLLTATVALAAFLPPLATAGGVDGRSPDTKDAAALVHAQTVALSDGRSPDTRDAAAIAHATQPAVDGRSPDTRDAAIVAHTAPVPSVIVVGNGGFNWTDAGIGAAGGVAIALLSGGALLLFRGGRGRLAL